MGCAQVKEVKQAEAETVEVKGPEAAEAKAPEVLDVSQIETFVDGEEGTKDYRLKFKGSKDGKDISPWHDIPLRTDQEFVLNMVVEIPKMTRKKMEVSTKNEQNPIAQDVKNEKLREYHGPIYWNYGMFPQTWEDPGKVLDMLMPDGSSRQVGGDNDPLDAVEIGTSTLPAGSVAQVKVLGALAMIDDGELDWKVICVHKDDKLAPLLNDIADVDTHCPGVTSGIREWLRWYKTPDGKALNEFGFEEERALDRAETMKVVAETNEAWQKLREGTTEKPSLWLPSPGKAEPAAGAPVPEASMGA